MAKVFLLLGSNLGDRLGYLSAAKNAIESNVGFIVSKSSIYESDAWGFESEHKFLNQVVRLSTSKPPMEILKKIKNIERQLGREYKSEGYESRTIDIDILFYDDIILDSEDLIIPHKSLQERRFALKPLNEIASGFIHPNLGKTITELLELCSDESEVTKFS